MCCNLQPFRTSGFVVRRASNLRWEVMLPTSNTEPRFGVRGGGGVLLLNIYIIYHAAQSTGSVQERWSLGFNVNEDFIAATVTEDEWILCNTFQRSPGPPHSY